MKGRTIEDHIERIEKIASEVDCPENFKCYKSGVLKLCETNILGGGSLVECLEKNGRNCKFGFSFGYSVICKCPVQTYLAKNRKDVLDGGVV